MYGLNVKLKTTDISHWYQQTRNKPITLLLSSSSISLRCGRTIWDAIWKTVQHIGQLETDLGSPDRLYVIDWTLFVNQPWPLVVQWHTAARSSHSTGHCWVQQASAFHGDPRDVSEQTTHGLLSPLSGFKIDDKWHYEGSDRSSKGFSSLCVSDLTAFQH